MELVLIACCNRKQCGGEPNFFSSIQMEMCLSEESYKRLIYLRSQVVMNCKNDMPRGQDLGLPDNQRKAKYLPAYQRYTGIIYTFGRVNELYPHQSKIRLVIISALYGLLDGEDLIQRYNVNMLDKISGKRLYTWWKHHKLGNILEECIISCKPTLIHDLLPINYKRALEPWPPSSLCHIWSTLNCAGLGQGANFHRGRYLNNLLIK